MKSPKSKKEILDYSQHRPILAFDGVCNLCNSFVHWLIKRDKKRVFRYATIQSSVGKEISEIKDTGLDSVVLINNGEVFTHSDVALEATKHIGGLWVVLYVLKIIPKSIRDLIYNWIAKNRYKWFGKKDECMVPSEDVKSLFI